jgi:hypothetical protein
VTAGNKAPAEAGRKQNDLLRLASFDLVVDTRHGELEAEYPVLIAKF